METAAGVPVQALALNALLAGPGTPVLISCADDLVALCRVAARSRTSQGSASPRGWRPGGCSSTKRRRDTTHLSEGFDFLGFNVRHYRVPGKLLIKPSKAAVKRISRQAARRGAQSSWRERDGRDQQAQPDPAGVGWLLPNGCVQEGTSGTSTPPSGGRCSKWGKRQHNTKNRPVDRGPLLRPVPPDPARPLDLRRPGDRRLPAETVVDADPSPPDGQSRCVPGRPGLGSLLG